MAWNPVSERLEQTRISELSGLELPLPARVDPYKDQKGVYFLVMYGVLHKILNGPLELQKENWTLRASWLPSALGRRPWTRSPSPFRSSMN